MHGDESLELTNGGRLRILPGNFLIGGRILLNGCFELLDDRLQDVPFRRPLDDNALQIGDSTRQLAIPDFRQDYVATEYRNGIAVAFRNQRQWTGDFFHELTPICTHVGNDQHEVTTQIRTIARSFERICLCLIEISAIVRSSGSNLFDRADFSVE